MSLLSIRFNTFLFSAIMFAAVLAVPHIAQAQASKASFTKAEIEKIIKDYLMANPEVIIDSVEAYQRGMTQDTQKKIIQEKFDDIYANDADPVIGNPDGDVTVVEFFDYNCGYCKRVLPLVMALIEEDKNVRVIFKEFPILGPSSEVASKWALAAHEQGKYFEFHQAVMETRKPLSKSLMKEIGKKVGLDVGKAEIYVEGPDVLIDLQANKTLAVDLGVRGTPAFVVGKEIIPGAIELSDMKELVAKMRGDNKDAKK